MTRVISDRERLEMVSAIAYNCGDCGKGGCLHSECTRWILQQIVEGKPFGICYWCGEPTEVPMEEYLEQTRGDGEWHSEELTCPTCRKQIDEEEAEAGIVLRIGEEDSNV